MTLKQQIARWLDPETAKDASRYRHMRSELEDARWWLGMKHPQSAALAEWILERDHWWVTSKRFPERHPWSPPAWVTSISDFRDWLDREAKKHHP